MALLDTNATETTYRTITRDYDDRNISHVFDVYDTYGRNIAVQREIGYVVIKFDPKNGHQYPRATPRE